MAFKEHYRSYCTLAYGDIYGQIIIWLIVIFSSLASALAFMSSPIYAFLTVGLILVLSLPFLLFSFVTTLLNHIEFRPVDAESTAQSPAASPSDVRQASPVG